MADLYNLKSTDEPGAYVITKFDNDLNPLKSYVITGDGCTCPRGEMGKPCRHRTALAMFKGRKHINDGWFLNYQTRQWIEPSADFAFSADQEANQNSNSNQAPVAEPTADPVLPPVAPAKDHDPRPSNATGAPNTSSNVKVRML